MLVQVGEVLQCEYGAWHVRTGIGSVVVVRQAIRSGLQALFRDTRSLRVSCSWRADILARV